MTVLNDNDGKETQREEGGEGRERRSRPVCRGGRSHGTDRSYHSASVAFAYVHCLYSRLLISKMVTSRLKFWFSPGEEGR